MATEIQEVLLQACINCGVPASRDSFKVVQEVIEQVEAERNAG